jgi:hypothetical protein
MPYPYGDRPRPEYTDDRYRYDWEREGKVGTQQAARTGNPSAGVTPEAEPGGGWYGRGYYGHDDPRNHPPAPGVRDPGRRFQYRRDDLRVFEDVCDRLTDDAVVDASDLTVKVEDGEVTLEGTVGTRHEKYWAEHLCARIPGVRDVHNFLRIRAVGERPWEPSRVDGRVRPNRML